MLEKVYAEIQFNQVEQFMSQNLNDTPAFSGSSGIISSLVSGLPLTAMVMNSPIVQLPGSSVNINSFLWQFQPGPNGGFIIFSTITQGVMQPKDKSMESEAPIVAAPLDGSDFQVWDFILFNPSNDPTTRTYFIQNRATGLFLDITADRVTPGTQLIQFPLNPQSFFNQIFLINHFTG